MKQLDSFSCQGWIEKQANICKERFISKKYQDFNTAPHILAYFLLVTGFQLCLPLTSLFSFVTLIQTHFWESVFVFSHTEVAMNTPGTLLDLYLLASPCHSDRWKANGRSIHGQKQISMVKNSQ